MSMELKMSLFLLFNFDGLNSQTWGGGTFMVHAPIGGTMDASIFGVNGGWAWTKNYKSLG